MWGARRRCRHPAPTGSPRGVPDGPTATMATAAQPGSPLGRRERRPKPASDSDSDSDGPVPGGARAAAAEGPACPQVIHSGHFMVSSPHSDRGPRGRRQPPDPPGIDPTLTRLFECMSLAYSGKLVSPKWKNFKGLRLLCRDKIRLNNAIWRAWYIQYVERRKSPVCGFVTPLDGSEADYHRKPEAVVLEGNYWKRRIEVVMKEYHKWRIYYKKRLRRFSREGEAAGPKADEDAWRPTETWCNQLFSNVVPMLLRDKEEEEEEEGRRQHLYDLESFLSDISDTLFTMTQGCGGPDPAPDEAYVGNADMIQPDLAPLQPSLDDFMEVSDFFSGPRALPTLPPLLGFQDQPCFAAEMLFGGSSSGGNLLPGPGDPLFTPAGPASGSPGLPAPHLQPPIGSPGAFLSPVGPPSAAPAGLGPDSLLKTKWLGPDPYGSYGTPATPVPPLPAHEPGCLLPPGPRAKPHYPALFACPPPSGLPAPPFARGLPGYGPTDLPLGYQDPFGGPPHLHPGGPGRAGFGSARGPAQLPGSGPRPQGKEVAGKSQRPQGAPPAPHAGLAQLLATAKPDPSLDGHPPLPGHPSAPVAPESLHQDGFCEEPPGPLPRMARLSPRLSPAPSPSPSNPAGALLVPKAERLSPTPLCGSDRKMPGQKSPGPAEGLVSLPSSYLGSRSKNEPSKTESRRITHISAEQKRRFNIKLGFDTLHSLVSTLSAQPSLKVSKATTLQKTAEYICKLQQERAALQEEAQRLRDQIEELNAAINQCQQQLPATGVPITRQRFDQMRAMFDAYVRSCTLQNWKFWVFSIIMRPLFESFNGMVSTSSLESLSQTSLAWLEQYCSLPALRPTVLSSLRQLSVSTSILTNPAGIPEQAVRAVAGPGANATSSS